MQDCQWGASQESDWGASHASACMEGPIYCTAGSPDLRAQDHKASSGPCTTQQAQELSRSRSQGIQSVACTAWQAADAINENLGTNNVTSMQLNVAQLNNICGGSSRLHGKLGR